MRILDTREIRKTRKPHSCEWCPEQIKQGSSSVRTTYVDGDWFTSYHMHPECHRAAQKCPGMQDGFMPNSFHRGTDREI